MDKTKIRALRRAFGSITNFILKAKHMNIIGHKKIYLSISGLLVLGSVIAIGVWGLKFGIDFTGGSLLEVEFSDSSRPGVDEVRRMLGPLGVGGVSVQPTGERGMILRFAHVDEETHQNILQALQVDAERGYAVIEKRFDAIGPTIGSELLRNSLIALALASLGIVLYLTWAFRNVSKPVSSWKYGVIAVLVAFLHDVPIPLGVFSLLGHTQGVEVDTLFITALLTILGFSVHDTIVVFDRIRENLRKLKSPEPFEVTVNRSINETIARSVNTSLTVLLVLVATMVFGGATTRYFSLALIVGIIFGTYSSIFVASPLLVVWQKLQSRWQGRTD